MQRRLLRTAKNISLYVYGEERDKRAINELKKEIPIFKLNGSLCAYTDTIDKFLLRKEQAALEALKVQA